jgi:G6PDH family F420-dependent oxidoreductase
MRIGFGLSCEEYAPADLLEQVEVAQEAGFSALWVSDHYHPWNNEQGQSPFVWSIIGAISRISDLPVVTAVTCPTVRIHPAVIAQAAATSAALTGDQFALGVGSGEALNEHILGDPWPGADRRLAMLEEAVEVIRKLLTGAVVNHHGRFYTVEHARIYTLPENPIPVYVSGLGPHATALAARIGDGYVSVRPDAQSVAQYRNGGGDGPALAGTKACYAATEDEAREIAYRLWPNESLPGELAQVLPTPEHFEQASRLVTPDRLQLPCGPDPGPHLEMIEAYRRAGYDTLYVGPVGPHWRGLVSLYRDHVLPALRE